VIAVCGEALIDLVDEGDELFRAHPGGSPANVAVGLSRLGIPVALIARVSQDAFGRLLRAHLIDNGVNLRVCGDRSRAQHAGRGVPRWGGSGLLRVLPQGDRGLAMGIRAATRRPTGRGRRVAFRIAGPVHRTSRERGHRTAALGACPRPGDDLRGPERAFEDDQTAARRRVERRVGLADVVKVSAEDLAWLALDESPSPAGPATGAGGPLLCPGTGDNAAAALGRDTRPGDVVVSIGTSGVACSVTDTPAADPSGTVATSGRNRPMPPAGSSHWWPR
jgi:fructokinase